jgi:hypothetical protein
MRRLARVVIAAAGALGLFAVALFASAPTAQAATSITLFEPSHRQLDGKFIDDQLAQMLDVNGSLGDPIFHPSAGTHIWIVDPALVEDVVAMSKGYALISSASPAGELIAQQWLEQLTRVTQTDVVYALPYGNPSGYWMHRALPHSVNYFFQAGQDHLTALLQRPVLAVSQYPSRKYFKLTADNITTYRTAMADFQTVASFLTSADYDSLLLRSARIFAADLEPSRREFLLRDVTATAYKLRHSLRIVAGKYTITASKQAVPITLINDFSVQAKVQLNLMALNSKVEVGPVSAMVLAPHSKTQVMVPLQVLTSGTSTVSADLMTIRGDLMGDTTLLPLNLKVINPIATWLTTGAGITLFFAALVQSFRRIRRRNT